MSTTDVVVIGGGIIGCSIAWRLAQRKLKVTVVDSGTIGGEASWAGAGMLAPGGEVTEESEWAKLSVQSLRMYPAFCVELEAATSGTVPIDFQITGAREFGDMPKLLRRAAAQSELGIQCKTEVDHIFYPDDAVVNPRDIVGALREACTILGGVQFLEGSPVTYLQQGSVTIGGSEILHADWIVLASGAWSSRILPGIPAAFPVKGHLIGYWTDPGDIGPIYRNGHHYVLQRKSGFVIAGSTTEHVGFDRSIDPQAVKDLHNDTKRVFPFLPDWPIESWIGFRPGAHGDPIVRQYEDQRIFLAYGHYRNGILNAPMTASIVANQIVP